MREEIDLKIGIFRKKYQIHHQDEFLTYLDNVEDNIMVIDDEGFEIKNVICIYKPLKIYLDIDGKEGRYKKYFFFNRRIKKY